MATYRLSAQVISRANGRSAPAAAAYRAGERIHDERTGETFYYRRNDVLDRGIMVPHETPAWVRNREGLWNAVESAERRKDAQVAREVQLSLPHELTLQENLALVRSYVREQFVARGMVADLAVHAAHRGGDERNIHAHVLLTTREVTPEGFGRKVRAWNDRALLETWRAEWDRHVNRALELARVDARVDHRSYAERGIDREPEPKQGPVATKMERLGRRSHAGEDRRRARQRNAERALLRGEEQRLAGAVELEERQREVQRYVARTRLQCRDHEQAHRNAVLLGIAQADGSRWRQWREQVLTDAYARDMAGSRLARFWKVDRTSNGLAFANARGEFQDHGHIIVTHNGNEIEIRGMLDVAQAKSWRELRVSGRDEFKRHAMTEALRRGFEIRAEGRDARILREVTADRDRSSHLEPAQRRNGDNGLQHHEAIERDRNQEWTR
jgi:hypothetical protein